MRKLDVLVIGLAVLVGGGVSYGTIQLLGVDTQQSGIWASLLLVLVLLGWTVTYLTRVLNRNMSIHEQTEAFKTEVFRKQIEAMTPEELAQFEAELATEGAAAADNSAMSEADGPADKQPAES